MTLTLIQVSWLKNNIIQRENLEINFISCPSTLSLRIKLKVFRDLGYKKIEFL